MCARLDVCILSCAYKYIYIYIYTQAFMCASAVWAYRYGFCVAAAMTDFCIRKLVKMSQRRKQLNSISATTFKTTREPVNGVRNLKSKKISLRKFSLPAKEVCSLRLSLYCMIVKAPLFWALLLLCELKCWILVLCSSHEGQSFAEVRGGLYEVQWKCFFFPALSQLFNKRQEYGSRCSAEACFGSERMGSWRIYRFS